MLVLSALVTREMLVKLTGLLGRFRIRSGQSQKSQSGEVYTPVLKKHLYSNIWLKFCDCPELIRDHIIVWLGYSGDAGLVWFGYSGDVGLVWLGYSGYAGLVWFDHSGDVGLVSLDYSGDVGLVWFSTREMCVSRVGTTSPESDHAPPEGKITRET